MLTTYYCFLKRNPSHRFFNLVLGLMCEIHFRIKTFQLQTTAVMTTTVHDGITFFCERSI